LVWKLAKVETLLTSKDNVVRSAKVRVLDKENKKIIFLRRPIQHLIPLEIQEDVKIEISGEQREEVQGAVENRTRPRRKAAIIGEENRKNCE